VFCPQTVLWLSVGLVLHTPFSFLLQLITHFLFLGRGTSVSPGVKLIDNSIFSSAPLRRYFAGLLPLPRRMCSACRITDLERNFGRSFVSGCRRLLLNPILRVGVGSEKPFFFPLAHGDGTSRSCLLPLRGISTRYIRKYGSFSPPVAFPPQYWSFRPLNLSFLLVFSPKTVSISLHAPQYPAY